MAFTLFLTKIKDGSLEIRKTKEPNHAKMYVFQNKWEFDELWKTAIVLADKNNLAEFENAVIEKIWYEKQYKPCCFFLRVLDEYFSVNYDKDFKTAYEITNGNFYDLKYQTDAIRIGACDDRNT